jgi:hypothetical protein
LLWNPQVHQLYHKIPSLDIVLSRLNPAVEHTSRTVDITAMTS